MSRHSAICRFEVTIMLVAKVLAWERFSIETARELADGQVIVDTNSVNQAVLRGVHSGVSGLYNCCNQ